MLKLIYKVHSGLHSHPVIYCILTWQITINYIHQVTPESTPSKKLAILDPPTRRWSYKPFLHLTEGKSQSTNTKHRINVSHTFTTVLAPPSFKPHTNQVAPKYNATPSRWRQPSSHICDKTQPLYLYNHLQLDMVNVFTTGTWYCIHLHMYDSYFVSTGDPTVH